MNPPPPPAEELDAAIDRLYQGPLPDFTAARNALAGARRAAGDGDGAARVKALAKPTAVAWAVNQLYWSERERFDRLTAALVEVAAAQREGLAGGGGAELREAVRRKSEALAEAARAAERRLVDSGGGTGPAVLQRIAATLEALSSPRPAGDPTRPRPGRLATELQPAGFDLVLGLGSMSLPPPPPRPADTTPAPRPEGSGEADWVARRQRQDALLEVGRLRREVEAAGQALGEAEAAAAAARSDLSGLEARVVQARARVEARNAAGEEALRRLETLQGSLAAAEAALRALEPTGKGRGQ